MAGEPRFVRPPVLARPSLRQLHAARLVTTRIPNSGPQAEGNAGGGAVGGGIAEAPGRYTQGAGGEALDGPRRPGEGEADDSSQCDFDLSSSSASAGMCKDSRPASPSGQGTVHGGSDANDDGPRVQLPTTGKSREGKDNCMASPSSLSPGSLPLSTLPSYSSLQGGLAHPPAMPPHDLHAKTVRSTMSARDSHDWNAVLSSSSTHARSAGKVANDTVEAEMSEWEYWGESPPRRIVVSPLSASIHAQSDGRGMPFEMKARRRATSPRDKWRANGDKWRAGGAWGGAGMEWQNEPRTRAQDQENFTETGPDAGPASSQSEIGVEIHEGWSTPSLSQLSPCSPLSSSSPVIEHSWSFPRGAMLLICHCFRSCPCRWMSFLKMVDMARKEMVLR